MPSRVTRFSISMPEDLLDQLDRLVKDAGLANRSQAVSKLVRDGLVELGSTRGEKDISGTIILVYDHHKRNLLSRLTSIQHDFGRAIVSTLHVHLDHNNCLEVLVVRGPSKHIRELANRLIAVKGVIRGRFIVAATVKIIHS